MVRCRDKKKVNWEGCESQGSRRRQLKADQQGLDVAASTGRNRTRIGRNTVSRSKEGGGVCRGSITKRKGEGGPAREKEALLPTTREEET